jgi:hypothetical protein
MIIFLKVLHVLSLGLWAGAVCFFSFFIALPTIAAMRKLAQTPGNWLGLKTEQEGTRLAGEFLDLVFARYFPFQFVCGLVALVTACWWVTHAGWLPKVRVTLVGLALLLVAANLWYFAPHVHELRQQRYSTDPEIARVANEAFNPAHTWSLLADMLGLLCVLAALALTPWLPAEHPENRAGAIRSVQ